MFGFLLSAVAGTVVDDSVATFSRNLEEISVVAVKHSANLNREAVSGTVLTPGVLQKENVMALKGVSDLVPNLFIPDYGSRVTSSIYIRGIGSRMDQPAVGLNVDNVPILNKNSYDFDLADIAGVEVLSGPQSVLFGRNTMGGLINVTTLSPMTYQGVRGMLDIATGERVRGSLGWYDKLNDRSAVSVTGNFTLDGGRFKNQYNGSRVGCETSGGLRTKYHHRVSDKLYLRNVLSISGVEQGGYPYESVESGKIEYNDTCAYRRVSISDGLSLNCRMNGWELFSISSLQLLSDKLQMDQDFLPLPYFTLTQKQRELAFTQDVVAKGKVGEKYCWMGGFFLFGKHMDMDAPVVFKDQGIASLIESHRNDMNPDYPIKWNTRSFPLNSNFNIPTLGVALYHESVINTGNWRLTGGMRFDWEYSRLNYRSWCDTGYTIYERTENGFIPMRDVPISINDRGKVSHTYFNWLPRLTASYEFVDIPGNVYASIAKGFKSGGFNTQMFSDVLKQRLMEVMGVGARFDVDDVVGYKPEHSWNYELGVHLPVIDNVLNFDFSTFYIDCRDQQITMFPTGEATGRITANAGRTRSCGLEAALAWHPISWASLNGSYGYTDARFVKFNDGIHDYSGNYIPYAPMHTMFLQCAVRKDLNRGWIDAIEIDANMRGVGKIYWNEDNSLSQPFYSLLGGSATARLGRFSLQVWGENLLNSEFYTFYFKSMGHEFLQRGQPARVGVTIRFDL